MREICFLLVLLCVGCSSPKGIEAIVRTAQKKALATSPYRTAKGAPVASHLKEKDPFAQLPGGLRRKVAEAVHTGDTIRMLQSFDLYCGTCRPFQTQVLIKDSVYIVVDASYSIDQRVIDRGMKAARFDPGNADHVYLSQHNKLIDVVIHNKQWNVNPLIYGDDACKDNNYSMVTIILPGKKAEAMYVRCWKPFYLRQAPK